MQTSLQDNLRYKHCHVFSKIMIKCIYITEGEYIYDFFNFFIYYFILFAYYTCQNHSVTTLKNNTNAKRITLGLR